MIKATLHQYSLSLFLLAVLVGTDHWRTRVVNNLINYVCLIKTGEGRIKGVFFSVDNSNTTSVSLLFLLTVLVDTTPPEAGTLVDGDDVHDDVDYTSETATMTASWSDFTDPESGMAPYSLAVYVNGDLQQTFTGIQEEQFTDHSFSFQHGDRVHVELLAKNRSEL